jgi:predicted XRE-type DNA-binding protein
MWIIGGPNGAGKSSFAGRFLDDLGHRQLIKLNADERTLALRAAFPDVPLNDLNLRAAIDIDKQVEDCIKAGQSFVVETVLSSPKYRDDVLAAKATGFKFGLIYVSLYPPELSPLAAKIIGVLDDRKLTVRAAHEVTGVAAADFSRIRKANLGRFTIDRLMTILAGLGQEVEVSVSVHPRRTAAPMELHP